MPLDTRNTQGTSKREYKVVTNYTDLSNLDVKSGDVAFVENASGVWGVNRTKAGAYMYDGTDWKFMGADVEKVTEDEIMTAKTVTDIKRMSPKDVVDIAQNWESLDATTDFNTVLTAGNYWFAANAAAAPNAPPIAATGIDRAHLEVKRYPNEVFVMQVFHSADPDDAGKFDDYWTRGIQLDGNGEASTVTDWKRIATSRDVTELSDRIDALETSFREELDSYDARARQLENIIIDNNVNGQRIVYVGRAKDTEIPWSTLDPLTPVTLSSSLQNDLQTVDSNDHIIIIINAQIQKASSKSLSDYKNWEIVYHSGTSGSLTDYKTISPKDWAVGNTYDGAWVLAIPTTTFDYIPRRIAIRSSTIPGGDNSSNNYEYQYRYCFAVWVARGYDMSKSQFYAAVNPYDQTEDKSEPLATDRAKIFGQAVMSDSAGTSGMWAHNNSSNSSSTTTIESNWKAYTSGVSTRSSRGSVLNMGVNNTNGNSTQRASTGMCILIPDVGA